MTIVLSNLFKKQFKRLDSTMQKRVKKYLKEVGGLDDPRTRGKALTGDLRKIWRYRVGDYRILCRIMDKELIITVMAVEHRSSVYREETW